MADRSAQAITLNGITPTAHAAASGDKLVAPGDRKILTVTNGGESSVTLTIAVPGNTTYGVAAPDKTFSIGAGATMAIPALGLYGDPEDAGKAALSWSATTSVTFTYTRV